MRVSRHFGISSPSAIPHDFNALSLPHIIIPFYFYPSVFIRLSALSDPECRHSALSLATHLSKSVILIPLVPLFFSYASGACVPALLCCFSCLTPLSAHNSDLLLFLEEMIKKQIWQKVCTDEKKLISYISFSPISPFFFLSLTWFVCYLLFTAFLVPFFLYFIAFLSILCSLPNAAGMMCHCLPM